MSDAALLARRLAAFRDRRDGDPADPRRAHEEIRAQERSGDLAERLAAAVDGEVVATDRGRVVRRVVPSVAVPLDRERLGRLPGWPAAGVPLVCLDTETTGLATAAGTVAFLVGVGRWHDDAFDQVQLLLPDHSDEPALLAALADVLPLDGWLVTYNGRGFDWPLLVARYRMDRRPAPQLAGHLDLLPFVRRVFRHRLEDARLRSVERGLLGIRRVGDVDGWEIPGRYLDFLRGGPADRLADVVRHNERDVASLAGLLGHVGATLADPDARTRTPAGDLVGLARVYRDARRHADALACLDAAFERARPDASDLAARRAHDALALERARTLRRLGRATEALAAWRGLVGAGGPFAGIALVEVAKALEHRWADPIGALEAVERACAIAERARSIGRPMPNLEADLAYRRRRLVARIARRRERPAVASTYRKARRVPALIARRPIPAGVA
ncbi:MAG TPA: ribonuclease H-like domain-containing protein [Candidatus Limnocylindrales bacterium]